MLRKAMMIKIKTRQGQSILGFVFAVIILIALSVGLTRIWSWFTINYGVRQIRYQNSRITAASPAGSGNQYLSAQINPALYKPLDLTEKWVFTGQPSGGEHYDFLPVTSIQDAEAKCKLQCPDCVRHDPPGCTCGDAACTCTAIPDCPCYAQCICTENIAPQLAMYDEQIRTFKNAARDMRTQAKSMEDKADECDDPWDLCWWGGFGAPGKQLREAARQLRKQGDRLCCGNCGGCWMGSIGSCCDHPNDPCCCSTPNYPCLPGSQAAVMQSLRNDTKNCCSACFIHTPAGCVCGTAGCTCTLQSPCATPQPEKIAIDNCIAELTTKQCCKLVEGQKAEWQTDINVLKKERAIALENVERICEGLEFPGCADLTCRPLECRGCINDEKVNPFDYPDPKPQNYSPNDYIRPTCEHWVYYRCKNTCTTSSEGQCSSACSGYCFEECFEEVGTHCSEDNGSCTFRPCYVNINNHDCRQGLSSVDPTCYNTCVNEHLPDWCSPAGVLGTRFRDCMNACFGHNPYPPTRTCCFDNSCPSYCFPAYPPIFACASCGLVKPYDVCLKDTNENCMGFCQDPASPFRLYQRYYNECCSSFGCGKEDEYGVAHCGFGVWDRRRHGYTNMNCWHTECAGLPPLSYHCWRVYEDGYDPDTAKVKFFQTLPAAFPDNCVETWFKSFPDYDTDPFGHHHLPGHGDPLNIYEAPGPSWNRNCSTLAAETCTEGPCDEDCEKPVDEPVGWQPPAACNLGTQIDPDTGETIIITPTCSVRELGCRQAKLYYNLSDDLIKLQAKQLAITGSRDYPAGCPAAPASECAIAGAADSYGCCSVDFVAGPDGVHGIDTCTSNRAKSICCGKREDCRTRTGTIHRQLITPCCLAGETHFECQQRCIQEGSQVCEPVEPDDPFKQCPQCAGIADPTAQGQCLDSCLELDMCCAEWCSVNESPINSKSCLNKCKTGVNPVCEDYIP